MSKHAHNGCSRLSITRIQIWPQARQLSPTLVHNAWPHLHATQLQRLHDIRPQLAYRGHPQICVELHAFGLWPDLEAHSAYRGPPHYANWATTYAHKVSTRGFWIPTRLQNMSTLVHDIPPRISNIRPRSSNTHPHQSSTSPRISIARPTMPTTHPDTSMMYVHARP